MSSVITVALPVFAIIAVGLLAGRLNLANAADSAALNRFVYRFGFPAALFGLMSGATRLTSMDARLALSYGIAAIAVFAIAYPIGRIAFRLDAMNAGAHAFASVIGNAVFLGLPIALGIAGWGRPFVTLMLVEGIVVISIGAALMSPPEASASAVTRATKILTRPLKNPLVAAALAGFLFASVGLTLPAPAQTFFDLLGRAAGPVALFSLGLFLATQPAPPLRETLGKSLAITICKMVILPVLAFSIATGLGVDDPAYLGALALFTVTPTAVGAFVMASQYGRYVEETAAAIALSTAISVVTISAVLMFFT